ncbi:DUF2075 domain-containing protein [Thomasclavelia sp.]|uniref:DUF2075 domain-containing protein n=1 Tax=Thomasclavelia sp. TaxID=3025757 RepID=UPI00257E9B05|nr:DUF2075 domain-containing protein [Thomasclavelia sp.]
MIVYQETKEQFLLDVYNDKIDEKIEKLVFERLNRRTGYSEYQTWMNSMQYMYKVLENKAIPSNSIVAIEYKVPNSNKRIDFIVSGEDEQGRESAIIIELKQWQSLNKIENMDGLVETKLNGHLTPVAHPSYQAWSYVSLIEDYNEDVRKYKINLQPCAYLHNYRKKEYDDLVDLCYEYYLDKAPVFTRGDTKKLAMFIARYVKKGNPDVMYHIDSGKIKPSKSLQDSLTNMLKGKPEFTLLDEQKVTYEKALAIAKENSARKQVYIIHGGPGTGKTVIAVNMLVELINRDKNIIYVTKNSAPREVYQKKLTDGGYKKVYINNLFKGSGVFINANENDFDCIIVDESHRLNAKSGMYQNNGENQIKEIINAAKFSIFFVDDHQIVTTSDIGSSKEIKKWCKYYNAIVYEDKLTSQFRCNGSDAYLSWVDNVLEIEDTANDELDIDYDVRIFDDPLALKKAIFEKNKIANKSRMLAGYCWKWQKNGRNRSDVHDIEIGDFSMSWNFASTKTWAIDEKSINEVGCIHTSQGLEFDYVGVIIGDDLRYENGKIITDFFKRAPTDRSIRGLKGQYKKDKESALKLADEIIKNTYRTLLTRGQKGCYIYCTNKELNEYLKLKLKRGKESVRKS